MKATVTDITSAPTPVLAAIADYNLAKAQLAKAKKNFADTEKLLIELVGAKDDGSFRTTIDDKYTVKTTGKINYKVNPEELLKIQPMMPAALLNRLFRRKTTETVSVDVKEYKYIKENEPGIFAMVKDAITTSSGKTALEVKEL